MIVGWQHYDNDLRLGGEALSAHYTRVGENHAVARAREMEDLDERLLRRGPLP